MVILSPRTRRRHLYSNRVSSPHPNLSIVHLLLLVVQVDVSSKFPHPTIPTFSSLHSCASLISPFSSLDSIPCLQFGTLPPTPSTSNDELCFLLRGAAIKPLVIARHNDSPSTSPSNEKECPISASPLQRSRIQCKGSPCYLKIHFTKLTTGRANLTQNSTPENSPKFSPLLSPLLTHINQCSFPVSQSPTPHHSLTPSSTSSLPPAGMRGDFPYICGWACG